MKLLASPPIGDGYSSPKVVYRYLELMFRIFSEELLSVRLMERAVFLAQ